MPAFSLEVPSSNVHRVGLLPPFPEGGRPGARGDPVAGSLDPGPIGKAPDVTAPGGAPRGPLHGGVGPNEGLSARGSGGHGGL